MLLNLDKQFETLDWWMEYRKEVYSSYFPVEIPPSPPPTPQQQYEAPLSLPQQLQQQCRNLQQQEEAEPKVFDEMPVRKLGCVNWCRRRNVDCTTKTMALVLSIKQNIQSAGYKQLSVSSCKPLINGDHHDGVISRLEVDRRSSNLSLKLNKVTFKELDKVTVEVENETESSLLQANKDSSIILKMVEVDSALSSQEEDAVVTENSDESQPVLSLQKYVFDSEVGKNALEMKNLVACTSFLLEQILVKAWVADKDAEALRCQKLFVGEEEAAQKRHAAVAEAFLENAQPFFIGVLSPTREMAIQISEQFEALGSGIGLKCSMLVGGVDMMQQAISLAKCPYVVVDTPGRLLNHFSNTNGFSFRILKYFVLEEADKLLNQEFEKSINEILKALPRDRRTYLFSASYPWVATGSMDQKLIIWDPGIPIHWVFTSTPATTTTSTLPSASTFISAAIYIGFFPSWNGI